MSKWLRDIGRRKRTTVRKRPRRRLAPEALDDRILLSVAELPIPLIDTLSSRPEGITRGPDGNLWFCERDADRIGRITPAGVVTQFSLAPGSKPDEITAGPDGNLWFNEFGSSRIGRISTAGVITEFSAGITPNSGPVGITRGPDGNIWFTELQANKIGRITPAGVVTEFSAGITPGGQPVLITAGPDGNLWFGENAGKIGRITPAGVVTEFSAGLAPESQIRGITAGPDGNLWFTEPNIRRIGRITPAGVITEVATVGATPLEITAGPDGNLWFTEFQSSRIGRLTTAGAFTEFAAGITTGASPYGIAVGPDGNIWFAEARVTGPFNTIGRLNLAQSPDETTTTLRASANTVVVGQTVTLTATVTALGGGAVTNGVVDFYINNTLGPSALLDANGHATVDLTAVGAGGPASLKAVLRSADFPASTSAVTNVTVNPASTTVALAPSVNPAVAGQSVTFTATVDVVAPGAGTPTGTVTFKDGTVILGTFPVGADGTAKITTSFASGGGHVITAVYSGDPNFVGSSRSFTEQVNPATTPGITAALSTTGVLTVTGDAQDNTIVISRDAAGTILVNNGAIAINGGPATVVNTLVIHVVAGEGNDSIAVSSTNGAMPDANIDGGTGNDTIAGGSGNDLLFGGGGNDTYLFDTDSALGSDTINDFSGGGDVNTLDFAATTTRAVKINLGNPAAQVVNVGLTLTLSSDTAVVNVVGGASADSLTGNALNNGITGGAGNDTIEGGGGNDVLTGGAGNDTYRFDTDNILGSDVIDESGGGIDTLDFSATTTRAVTINLGSAAAQAVNAGLTLTLSSGATIENVIGGALGDTLTGNALNNSLSGGGGNDTLTGGAGNDVYRFDTDLALGSDTIDESGGGIDTLDFSATTTRAVTINLGSAAAQAVNAGLTLTLSSGATIENVIGGALGDTLTGNALNNSLSGGGGNDILAGGAGNDTIEGGAGNDTLTGGSGNDTYRFDTDNALGSDTIDESGGGVDTLDFSATTTRAVTINLGNPAAQVVNAGLTLTLSATNTIENVVGGALGDTITGNDLDNFLSGGAGNDTLDGGAGTDRLDGGAGTDVGIDGEVLINIP